MKVPISQIKVTRSRFRKENPDPKPLGDSLIQFGQLVPVIIDTEMELLDGFCRLTAALAIGWTEIEVIQKADVDEVLAREIELETNIQRNQFTWPEQCAGVVELDRLRRAKDPNWTNAQTAAVAGIAGPARVSEAKYIMTAAKMFPEVLEAKNLAQARKWVQAKASNVLRVQEVKDSPKDYAELEAKLVLGDSVEVIKTIPDGSFHAIITDPPFGVDYGERMAGTIGELTAYEDDRDAYWRLLGMAPDLYRVLKPNGFMIWFMGMSWYQTAREVFRGVGFNVDEIPLIWDRSDGRCFTNQPSYLWPKGYDIALSCRKGEAVFTKRPESNVLRVSPVPSADRTALVERPVELYARLINHLTLPGERVADFFTGSGSCLAAAALTGRDFFGVELSPERRAIALGKIKAHTPAP